MPYNRAKRGFWTIPAKFNKKMFFEVIYSNLRAEINVKFEGGSFTKEIPLAEVSENLKILLKKLRGCHFTKKSLITILLHAKFKKSRSPYGF